MFTLATKVVKFRHKLNEVKYKMTKDIFDSSTSSEALSVSEYTLEADGREEGSHKAKFRMLTSDEAWNFVRGTGLIVHQINCYGDIETGLLCDVNPSLTIRKDTWVAVEMMTEGAGDISVMSITTVGWQSDAIASNPKSLPAIYPQHIDLINQFT